MVPGKKLSITLPVKGILTLVIMGIHGGFPWWLYALVFHTALIIRRD